MCTTKFSLLSHSKFRTFSDDDNNRSNGNDKKTWTHFYEVFFFLWKNSLGYAKWRTKLAGTEVFKGANIAQLANVRLVE